MLLYMEKLEARVTIKQLLWQCHVVCYRCSVYWRVICEQLSVWEFVTSDVGKFLSFISVLVDFGQRPDKACPLIGFRHADLLSYIVDLHLSL